MVQNTTHLGGTASAVTVGKVAHGLMTMTMASPEPTPDEQAFDSIKSGIDALPAGAKMILNSAEYYGYGWSIGNLELLARFFDKYPGYADKTFLSVKGGLKGCSPQALRESVDKCVNALRGTKKIDLFQPGRLDRQVSVENTMTTLVGLLKEGKFDHIGLSEVSAASLRRGHAIYPVSVVEIEVSPMSYEDETKKVLAAAVELDVAVAAYSPLGHGLFTGTVQNLADLPPDFSWLSRFQEENWKYNRRLVNAFVSLAKEKGCTPAQLSIAWVGSLGKKVIPLPGSSRKERTMENVEGGDVTLTEAEKAQIADIMATNPVHGDRYYGEGQQNLWG